MKIKLDGLIKNKYALIVIAVGIAVLLWPTGGEKSKETPEETLKDISVPAFSLADEELRLEKQLGQIRGAGRVSVLLAVDGSVSRELAESGEEILVISESGSEKVVELYYVNPVYIGAVVVCEGASSASVRLEITKAVAVFTGLGTDRIQIVEMA